jgi:hypothetical protein
LLSSFAFQLERSVSVIIRGYNPAVILGS